MFIKTFRKSFIKNLRNAFMGKKGQLEINITLMVILVFVILLVFSLVFYFRFAYGEIKGTKEFLLDQRYSALLNTIIGLPEFRCSKLGVESECLDGAKLNEINKIIENNKDYYQGVFGNVKGIWVDILNLEEKQDYSGEGLFLIYGERSGEGLIYAVPVSVYYPDYDRYKIGILKIRGELK